MPEGPWAKFAGGAEADARESGPWARFQAPEKTATGDKPNAMLGPNALKPSPMLAAAESVIGAPEKFAEEYTAGFGPKIEAALAAPFTGNGKTSLADEYGKNLNNIDDRMAEFKRESPLISGAATLGGGVASPLNKLFGGTKTLKEAATAKGLVKNALAGSAYGATEGAGQSRGGATQMAQDALHGAEWGGGLGSVGPALLHGVGVAGKAAKDLYSVQQSGLSKEAQSAAKELASQGIDVSHMTKVPAAASGLVRGYFANTLFGGIPVRSAAKRVSAQAGTAFDATLDKVGKALDSAGAGSAIHHGISVATRQFKAAAGKLYDKADDLIAPAGMNMMVKTDNLRKTLLGPTTPLKGLKLEKTLGDPDTEKLSKEILDGVKEANKKGRMNYTTLKAIRSQIGAKISNSPFGDPMHGYWKQLYGALSEDMTAAAKAASPEAHKAAVEANEFYKHGLAEHERFVAKYGSNVEATTAFRAIANRDTLAHNPQRVVDLFSRMPTSARKTVGATVIKQLGQKADGGEFSPAQWSTSWSKISPTARKALAGGEENLKELDKLARNIDRIKPLTQAVPETGIKSAALLTDWSAAANILNPVMWPVAIGKVVMDAAGGWFLTRPQNIRELNEVIESGDRTKGAALLRKASEHVLDDAHKKMLLDAADFLIRNRNGVIGMYAGENDQG